MCHLSVGNVLKLVVVVVGGGGLKSAHSFFSRNDTKVFFWWWYNLVLLWQQCLEKDDDYCKDYYSWSDGNSRVGDSLVLDASLAVKILQYP